MKKRFWIIFLFVFCLLVFSCGQADTLEEQAEAFRSAETADEQLALLSRLADAYAGELENGGWDVSLRVKCAEGWPRDLIPMNFDTYGYTSADGFPEDARGHKFIALYIARDGEQPELAGEWLARFPADMRAASLEEAEYALVAEGWWTPSGYNYIPPASSSHRDYAAYVLNLQTGEAVRFWSHRNGAKSSGKWGQLSGDSMSTGELWKALRAYVWGVIRYDLGDGAALLFTPTGDNCYLKGYEGSPVDVAVPEEVEGYPVTYVAKGGLSGCRTLESLVVPDSVAEIESGAFSGCTVLRSVVLPAGLSRIPASAFSSCYELTDIVFPRNLESIGSSAFAYCYRLAELALPDGLQSIGSSAFSEAHSLEKVTLPASLTSVGESAFYECSSLASAAFSEGITALASDVFRYDYHLACIWLPASLDRDYGLDSMDAHTVVCAPEGSWALQWAADNGREAVACESPSAMPDVRYVAADGVTYRVFRGEAMVAAVSVAGGEAGPEEIAVPDTVADVPVTGMLYHAVSDVPDLHTVTLPESIRIIHSRAVVSASGVRDFHVYLPNPDCVVEKDGIRPLTIDSGNRYIVTVHGPEGSAVQRYVTDAGQPDFILFEAEGGSVDPSVRTLKDALALASGVQENAAAFWQGCDRDEYSLLGAVPGYDIGRPDAVAVLRISGAELTDSSLQMAGNANALRMYATLANTRADRAYAKAATQTALQVRLDPVADGVSAIVVLAYPEDWILVSLMQDGNSQAILLSSAAGTPAELTAAYVTETAAACGVEGECTLWSGPDFAAVTGR